jgi:hypothetical protein
LLLLSALRAGDIRVAFRPFFGYLVSVLPLAGVIVYDQLVAGSSGSPAHALSASYLYSIVRVPHHVAPFASLYELGFWLHGVFASIGLLLALVLLALKGKPAERPLVIWIALLLSYLLIAFALSPLDLKSGIFGQFLPFRPSAVTLLFAILAFVLAYRWLDDGVNSRFADTLRKAALLAILPVFVWSGAKDHIKTIGLGSGYKDLGPALAFIATHAGPDDIVLTDPNSDMTPLGADLPRLVPRPTLVSFKFAPQTPADIYRWWDLLQFRKAVLAGQCPTAEDPPVRYILYVDRPKEEDPKCGHVVWRSSHFMIADLTSLAQ